MDMVVWFLSSGALDHVLCSNRTQWSCVNVDGATLHDSENLRVFLHIDLKDELESLFLTKETAIDGTISVS